MKSSLTIVKIVLTVASIVSIGTALGATVYFSVLKNNPPVAVQPTPTTTPILTPTISLTPVPTVTPTTDTSDWKTYRNEQFGYEIKYPENWYLYDVDSSDIFVQPDKETPDNIPGPHASALEIKVKSVKVNYDPIQEVKPDFDKAGISFTKEPIIIGGVQGLKVVSVCEGAGCGAPQWLVIKNGTLYHFDSNLGYSKIFERILSTFRFIK